MVKTIDACQNRVRPAPRRAKEACGGVVIYLVGTARVPMCKRCAAKFPEYVDRVEQLRQLKRSTVIDRNA